MGGNPTSKQPRREKQGEGRDLPLSRVREVSPGPPCRGFEPLPNHRGYKGVQNTPPSEDFGRLRNPLRKGVRNPFGRLF